MMDALAVAWIPGGWEWFAILAIAFLLFGNRLPKIAKGLGETVGLFKHGANEALDFGMEDDDEKRKRS